MDSTYLNNWIKDESKVIDLGCGDGSLLRDLMNTKNVHGFGVENDLEKIEKCIENNIPVIQHDLDDGLKDFKHLGFDAAIMASSIQCLRNPKSALIDLLDVATTCVVSIPNFGYWKIRLLMMAGRMPVSSRLPSKWYETKNIHLCTIKDFEELCAELNLKILEKIYLNDHGRPLKKLKRGNLLAAEGVYLIGA